MIAETSLEKGVILVRPIPGIFDSED